MSDGFRKGDFLPIQEIANYCFIPMAELPLEAKRVLLREDLNSSMEKGVLLDDTRLRAIIPSVKLAVAKENTIHKKANIRTKGKKIFALILERIS